MKTRLPKVRHGGAGSGRYRPPKKDKERKMARRGRVAIGRANPVCCGAATVVVFYSEGKRPRTHFWCGTCQTATPTRKGAKL